MDGKHRKTFRKQQGVDWVPTTHESRVPFLSLFLSVSRCERVFDRETARSDRISLRGWNTIGQEHRVRKAATDPSWNTNWEACLVAPRRDIPIYTEWGWEEEIGRRNPFGAPREGGPSNRPGVNERIRKYVAAAQHVARNLATSRRGRRLTPWSTSYRGGITMRFLIWNEMSYSRRVWLPSTRKRERERGMRLCG